MTARRVIAALVLAVAVVLTCSSTAAAQNRNARKVLRQLKMVDGAGSGLDADTIRGLAPEQIVGQAVDQATAGVTAGIAALLSSAYTRVAAATVLPGFCNCAQVGCERPGDFLVTCTGATPNDGTAYLTGIDNRVITGAFVCSVCACTTSSFTSSVGAGATCLPGS